LEEKVAFARMYKTKNSYNARDFLRRVYFLLDGRVLNAGHNHGSEFQKLFAKECKRLNIPQWYSRPYTPKDNSVNERFNQSLKQEFIDFGNFTPDVNIFNRNLTEWLIEYNFKRPHQALGYKTPIEFACGKGQLSKMYSSYT
jgi:IS30 family transposase